MNKRVPRHHFHNFIKKKHPNYYDAQPIPAALESSITTFFQEVVDLGFDLTKEDAPPQRGWYGNDDMF